MTSLLLNLTLRRFRGCVAFTVLVTFPVTAQTLPDNLPQRFHRISLPP